MQNDDLEQKCFLFADFRIHTTHHSAGHVASKTNAEKYVAYEGMYITLSTHSSDNLVVILFAKPNSILHSIVLAQTPQLGF